MSAKVKKCKHKWKLIDPHDSDWDYGYFDCVKCGISEKRKYEDSEQIQDSLDIIKGDLEKLEGK